MLLLGTRRHDDRCCWPDIERLLAGDITSGRPDDLREAAASIAVAEGAGVEDVAISHDRPIGVVARDVMTFLGWL